MFKAASFFRINGLFSFPSIAELEGSLGSGAFVPCTPTQETSSGWVPSRGEANGPLIESVSGNWFLLFTTEQKKVPADVVKRKLAEKVKEIEDQEARKVGKRQKKELSEEIVNSLLPNAFAKRSQCHVWIDPGTRLLCIESTSHAKTDLVISTLVRALEGFSAYPLATLTTPASAMSLWLTEPDPPAGFSVDRNCEIKAPDSSKAGIRYANHALDIEEIREHIKSGKVPTRLALTWQDRLSFEMTDTLVLKKISFLDIVFENNPDDGFDSKAAILCGEFSKMVPDMLEAMGGEVSLAIVDAALPNQQ